MTDTVTPTEGQPAPWLNGIQGSTAQELIESDAQVIRVIAGPGSGKTTCLKRRIQRLVQKNGIDPKTMFVGTFTRAIARELQDALGAQVRVSTLHALAYELLRKYPSACQGMRLRFLLKFEEDALLYDVEDTAAPIGDIHKRREALRLLQASRARRMEYDNAAFSGAVRKWLQRHQGMLIGEVVYLCVVGLESQDIPRGMFDYVVIDEYQDLTTAEQELVNFSWSHRGALTVLGDDDQSIYGFRFNHPEGITGFEQTWPQCTDLTFSDNRRCGDRILRMANLMMAEAGSKKPPMVPKSARAGNLLSVQWETLNDEINGLAEHIRNRSKESFLVLVPRRFIGYRLAEAIANETRTAFSEEVLEHQIAQECFTIASLVSNPDDYVAARVFLGFHGMKHGHASQYNASAYANLPQDIGGHELIRRIAGGQIDVSGHGQKNIKLRAEQALALINKSLSIEEFIDFVFNDTVAQQEPDEEKRRWLIDDLKELREAAHELNSGPRLLTLPQIIDRLRYRIATRLPLRVSEMEESRVKIMTLHSAKGLEADNVIVAGISDQFMPGKDRDNAEVSAEQKRLLYVAITRAKENLIISWHRKILTADVMQNGGRLDRVITESGVRWGITSRSSLLPQGLAGVLSGSDFRSLLPPDG